MPVARVFKSGNSQAVRLPKAFRLDTDQVEITRQGDSLVLTPTSQSFGMSVLEAMEELGSLIELPDDPPAEPIEPWEVSGQSDGRHREDEPRPVVRRSRPR